jgi:hypothetical protein
MRPASRLAAVVPSVISMGDATPAAPGSTQALSNGLSTYLRRLINSPGRLAGHPRLNASMGEQLPSPGVAESAHHHQLGLNP